MLGSRPGRERGLARSRQLRRRLPRGHDGPSARCLHRYRKMQLRLPMALHMSLRVALTLHISLALALALYLSLSLTRHLHL